MALVKASVLSFLPSPSAPKSTRLNLRVRNPWQGGFQFLDGGDIDVAGPVLRQQWGRQSQEGKGHDRQQDEAHGGSHLGSRIGGDTDGRNADAASCFRSQYITVRPEACPAPCRSSEFRFTRTRYSVLITQYSVLNTAGGRRVWSAPPRTSAAPPALSLSCPFPCSNQGGTESFLRQRSFPPFLSSFRPYSFLASIFLSLIFLSASPRLVLAA